MKYFSIILFFLYSFQAYAQKDIDIKKQLEKIENGEVTEVKNEIPKLQKKYPGSASLKFLQAVLTENSEESVKLYSNIVLKHPKSEYAPEALFRIYEYYLLLNNSIKAKEKYSQLKKQYPTFLKNRYEKKTESYTIQLGAFSSSANAQKFVNSLKNKGYKSSVTQTNSENRKIFFVTYGNFKTKEAAETNQKVVEQKLNIATIITQKQ